jgi:hypothetical protein
VDDAVLVDLRERLGRVRWPDEAPGGVAWQFGTDLTYLRGLVDYWRDGFDWRAQEARLNAWPQSVVSIAGIDLHFVHVPGIGPNPMTLVLSHGWPGSVFEFHKLIPLLTDPASHGGDPADAFTVIAPSLPGFTLSYTPGQPRLLRPPIEPVAPVVHQAAHIAQIGAELPGRPLRSLVGPAHPTQSLAQIDQYLIGHIQPKRSRLPCHERKYRPVPTPAILSPHRNGGRRSGDEKSELGGVPRVR